MKSFFALEKASHMFATAMRVISVPLMAVFIFDGDIDRATLVVLALIGMELIDLRRELTKSGDKREGK